MKDPLYGNKIAAAALVTILLAFGLPITIQTMGKIFGGHHHHDEDNPWGTVYPTSDAIVLAGGGPVEEEIIPIEVYWAEASAQRGERAAGLCAACHTFEQGGAQGIGPNLWNVVGREVGGVSGFGYSSVMADYSGPWDYYNLDKYLENSQSYMPGTAMNQMVRKDDKRADILAYLQSLSDSPIPFPEPPVVEEVVEADAAGAAEDISIVDAVGEAVVGVVEDSATEAEETVTEVIEELIDSSGTEELTDGQ